MGKKKVAVITGGSSGIGRAIGKKLLQQDYDVVNADILTPDDENHTHHVPCDITKAGDIDRLYAQVIDYYGVPDVLISNAGLGIHEKITEGDPEKWAKVIDINLMGTLRFLRAFVQDMVKNSAGTVFFISSTAATQAYEYGGIYSASKAALNMVAKTLQLEVGEKLRICLISPGVVDTAFFQNMVSGHHTVDDIGWGSLPPEHVAAMVSSILLLPPSVNLPEITIVPPLQPT